MTSRFKQLQEGAAAILSESAGWPETVRVIARREKDAANDIDAAVAAIGCAVYVMPPLPQRALQGAPFVFFERAEVRVRVIENPLLNESGSDGYELAEMIALALHNQNPGGLLAEPMGLAETPVELAEDDGARVMDVVFGCAFQLDQEETE